MLDYGPQCLADNFQPADLYSKYFAKTLRMVWPAGTIQPWTAKDSRGRMCGII